MATHYETLGVSPSASHDEIRRAYHDAARLWHPDRFVGRSEEASNDASDSMRQVNEAWRVLGDPDRRRSYDLGRSPTGGAGAPTDRFRTADGVTRIDPRLLDPSVLEARRRAQHAEQESSHSAILRVLPVLSFFVLIIGIFVFTAYARGSSSTSPSDSTVPGPSIGVEAGACVRVQSGPSLIEVPCTGTIDGRVLGAYEPGGACPVLTLREVTLSNDVTACLGA